MNATTPAPARDPAPADHGPRRRRLPWMIAYLIALLLSHLYHRGGTGPRELPSGMAHVDIPRFDRAGDPLAGRATIAYIDSSPRAGAVAPAPRLPVVLLHGSPGEAHDFSKLIIALNARGYRVLAPDLPGFGASTHPGSRSILSHAHAVQAWLNSLGIPRAHLVGWSNGGGVALHLADFDPDRVASLTLLASIGAQENEGSGSYVFEHFKYAVGLAAFGVAPELVPHFGLLGTFRARTAWLLNFWESDQRPLREIMKRLGERRLPTLILHGRRDVLVPFLGAEDHHRLIASSSLVIIDANHFIPFLQAEEAAEILTPFLERHDARGVTPRTVVDDRAPVPPPHGLDLWIQAIRLRTWFAPWVAEVSVIAFGTLLSPGLTIVVAGLLIVGIDLDLAVAVVGVGLGFMLQTIGLAVLGRTGGWGFRDVPVLSRFLPSPSAVDWSRRLGVRPFREGFRSQFLRQTRVGSAFGAGLAKAGTLRTGAFFAGRATGIALWAIVSLVIVVAVESLIVKGIRQKLGLVGVVYTLVKLFLIAEIVPMLLTRPGRQHLRGMIGRLLHHEYWPAWVFYAPLIPYTWWLGLKYAGFNTPTCCNPSIENGGGWVGESKSAIMAKLRAGAPLWSPRDPAPSVLETILITAGPAPAERARDALALMQRSASIRSFPLAVKPDQGERGHAFRVLRSADELEPYLRAMTKDAILQPYHPGPMECGILWMRRPLTRRAEAPGIGSIYSITRKEFPSVTGDGVRTLEELIRSHPRFRNQAGIFLDRFLDEQSRVPAAGEQIRLAMSGNHCQGTLFRDGADLLTPQLEAAIDRLARAFPDLDYGRFDIRYESDETLKRGEGFAVLELNGVTSESTNMYDPGRSPLFAYRVLFGLWRRIYELGAERRRQGVRPISVLQVIRMALRHARQRAGPTLAD